MSAVPLRAEPTRVCDRMTCHVLSVNTETPLGMIEKFLIAHNISAAPVLDQARRVAGIITTTDLVATSLPPTRLANELMTAPVTIAHAGENILEAAWRIVSAPAHRLVVIDEKDTAIGILSATDLLEEVMSRDLPDPLSTIMRSPVEVIGIGDSIALATERLVAANVHGIVVVDEMSPVGVFTHAEALAARRLTDEYRKKPVEEMMSYETLCFDQSTTIRRAAANALVMNARRILVTHGRQLVGIVTPFDLVSALLRFVEN